MGFLIPSARDGGDRKARLMKVSGADCSATVGAPQLGPRASGLVWCCNFRMAEIVARDFVSRPPPKFLRPALSQKLFLQIFVRAGTRFLNFVLLNLRRS